MCQPLERQIIRFFFFFFFGLFFVVFFAEDLRKIKRENRGILKQVKDTPSIPSIEKQIVGHI